MEFKRRQYLEQMIASLGNGMAKIITGPRRSGKSYLLFHIFRDYLLANGVDEDHIVELKLDLMRNASYRGLDAFVSFFREKRVCDGKTYFFLIDEIQLVERKENPNVKGQMLTFYDALNEFLDYGDVEIFVTGSNSHMLSSDIATEFRGRGWQIKMRPLSFFEIKEACLSSKNDFELWDDYWKYGGLPRAVAESSEERKRQYLSEVYLTTYLKDIEERNSLKGEESLKEIASFLGSSVGSLVNPTKISNTFRSKGVSNVSPNTVRRCLSCFEDAFLLSSARRFDLKGKKIIGGSCKCYFLDMGIRSASTGFKGMDQEPHIMENIIYNELLLRGYLVNVGVVVNVENVGGKPTKVAREVDFVCEKNGRRIYVQSAFLIEDEKKLRQEKEAFRRIGDSFQRVIISKFSSGSSYDEDGTLRLGLFDFLLGKETLLS